MEPTRVEIPADFLPSEADHLRLRQIVAKYAVIRTRRVLEELGDEYAELLLATQHLMEARLSEPKEGEPSYEEYEDMVVCRDAAGMRVAYFDQEAERGPVGFWASNAAAQVLLIVEKLVDGTLTRHYLLVTWSDEKKRWISVYPCDESEDVPQPGHVFAVIDGSSQAMLLVTPRIHEVLDVLVGTRT